MKRIRSAFTCARSNRAKANWKHTSIIPPLEELGNLLLRLTIIELLQTHLQEAIKDHHVSAQSLLQLIKVILDEQPQVSASFGVCGQGSGTGVDILGCHVVEEEGEVVWKEREILNSAKGAKGDFFAVDGRGRSPFCFDGVVFGFAAVLDGDGVDGGAEVGVDGGFILTGNVEVEAALGFCNYPATF